MNPKREGRMGTEEGRKGEREGKKCEGRKEKLYVDEP